ncbi:MAG: siderophore-interacting protein [Ottowia sp.]|nr:siderophore-interacting protein [Ottowia sp.]
MTASSTSPVRRVERVRHELHFRDVQVARVEPFGAEFVRVVFAGESLGNFVSLGFDDHLKFICPDPAAAPDAPPARRDYTPRAWNTERRELTVDFALHGEGVASDWARQAQPGQSVVIAGPRGSMVVPTDYAWHLLIGDATAAPAIARRVSELPAGARAIVVVQLADTAILGLDGSAAHIDLHQVVSGEAMLNTVKRLLPIEGEGYVWGAGEASIMMRMRDLVLYEKGHPREAMRMASYWKQGAKDFHHEDLE